MSKQITIVIPIHPDELDLDIKNHVEDIEIKCGKVDNIDKIILVSNKKDLKYKLKLRTRILVLYEVVPNNIKLTRAHAMNKGFLSSKSEIVMFLHVDTKLPFNFDSMVITKLTENNFCYFYLQYDQNNLLIKLIEKTVNNIRNFPYGDQCFCVKSEYHHKIGMFPDIPFMEDYEYVEKRLKPEERSNVITTPIITSVRRYTGSKHGLTLSSVQKNMRNNRHLIQRYHAGECINRLHDIYYKNGLFGTFYYEY